MVVLVFAIVAGRKANHKTVLAFSTPIVSKVGAEQQAVDRLVALVLNPTTRVQPRWRALEKIGEMPAYRAEAYTKIGNASPLHGIVLGVARRLIIEEDKPEVGFGILQRRFSILPSDALATFLREYLKVDYPQISPESAPLARSVITREIEKFKKETPRKTLLYKGYYRGNALVDNLDNSLAAPALILAENSSEEDKALIRSAVHLRPLTIGLWNALAKCDGITSPELALGKKLYAVVGALPELRLQTSFKGFVLRKEKDALMIVLSPYDITIKNSLRNRVRTFLQKYGRLSVEEYVSMGVRTLHPTPLRQDEFVIGNNLVSRLRFMNVPFAQNPVKDCIKVQSVFISPTAYSVIADKYPEILLSQLKSKNARSFFMKKFNEKEPDLLSKLLLFFDLKHPEYSNQTTGIISSSERKATEENLADTSFGWLIPSADTNSFLGL